MSASFSIDFEHSAEQFYTKHDIADIDLRHSVLSGNKIDLDALSGLALNPKYTDQLIYSFHSLFPDLSARWLLHSRDSSVAARAFARALPLIPHILPHAIAFFQNYSWQQKILLEDLIALYRLISYDAALFGSLVDLASISYAMKSGDSDAAKYVALKIWAIRLRLSDEESHRLVVQNLGGLEHELLGVYEEKPGTDFLFFE